MDSKNQKRVAPKGLSRDPRRAANVHSESVLESIIALLSLGYTALSLGRPRKHDSRSAAEIYSDCALESISVLFGLGNEALSLGRARDQATLNQVKDPATSASPSVRQSEGEKRAKIHELSEQISELSKKLRAARKRLVELQREEEKCPIEGGWEAPLDQLSLEELKFHKRNHEELYKMLSQAIDNRKTDSHGNNSDDLPRE